MTTTRIYRSTDTDAPVLTGQVGSLLNLLDKCLVDGYTGKTAAGWTRPYTGTNKTVYRNSVAAGGTGMYLRVLDDASATGAERNAICRIYSAMSDVDTGNDETPSVAQATYGTVWRKSNTIDSTARAWVLIADERTMYLSIDTGTSSIGDGFYGAGDFASEVAGDAYAAMVFGRTTPSAGGSNGESVSTGPLQRSQWFLTPGAGNANLWTLRGYAGGAGAVRHGLAVLASSDVGSVIGSSGSQSMAASSPGGGQVYWLPGLMAAEGTLRGTMRGLYVPINSLAGVAAGTDYSSAVGRPAGSVLTVVRHFCTANGSSAQYDGHFAVESALEW